MWACGVSRRYFDRDVECVAKPKLGEIVNEFKLDQEVQASGFTAEEESLLLEVGEGGEGEV